MERWPKADPVFRPTGRLSSLAPLGCMRARVVELYRLACPQQSLWHALPKALSEAPCGFARKWASVSLAQRLFSPYRTMQPPVETLKAPSWPAKIFYLRDW
jgi:hypothetical protein